MQPGGYALASRPITARRRGALSYMVTSTINLANRFSDQGPTISKITRFNFPLVLNDYHGANKLLMVSFVTNISAALIKSANKLLTVTLPNSFSIFGPVIQKIIVVPITQLFSIVDIVARNLAITIPVAQTVQLFKSTDTIIRVYLGSAVSYVAQIAKTIVVYIDNSVIMSSIKSFLRTISFSQPLAVMFDPSKAANVIFSSFIGQIFSFTYSNAISRTFTAAIGQVFSMRDSLEKIIVFNIDQSVSAIKSISKSISFRLTQTVSAIKSTTKSFTTRIGSALGLYKGTDKIFTVPVGSDISVYKSISKILTNSISSVVNLFRSNRKSFRISQPQAMSFSAIAEINRVFAIAFDSSVSLYKSLEKRIVFGWDQSIATVKEIAKALSFSKGQSVFTSTTPGKVFSAEIGQSITLPRSIGTLIRVAWDSAFSYVASVSKTFTASLGQTVEISKTTLKSFLIAIGQLVSRGSSVGRTFRFNIGSAVYETGAMTALKMFRTYLGQRVIARRSNRVILRITQSFAISFRVRLSKTIIVPISHAITRGQAIRKTIRFRTSNAVLYIAGVGKVIRIEFAENFFLRRRLQKIITVFQTQSLRPVKGMQRAILFARSQTVSAIKSAGKIFTISYPNRLDIVKSTGKLVTIAVNQVVSAVKSIDKMFSVAFSSVLNFNRQKAYPVIASILLGQQITYVRSFGKRIIVPIANVFSTVRRFFIGDIGEIVARLGASSRDAITAVAVRTVPAIRASLVTANTMIVSLRAQTNQIIARLRDMVTINVRKD